MKTRTIGTITLFLSTILLTSFHQLNNDKEIDLSDDVMLKEFDKFAYLISQH